MAPIEMERDGIILDGARRRRPDRSPRSGRAGEFGAAQAFLRGVQAGYISGVNRHLDGGGYMGLV
jgi:hypothetical protein